MADPKESDEFVKAWDVYRRTDGTPVTITWEQARAVWHAVHVVEAVRRSEDYRSLLIAHPHASPEAELAKSRLLGRMLFDGLPPTKTKPPTGWGPGPVWSEMPGGDPFADPNFRGGEAS